MGSFQPKYEITDEMLNFVLEITSNLSKLPNMEALNRMKKLKITNLAKEINSLISFQNMLLPEEERKTKETEKIFLNKDRDYLAYHNLNFAYNEMPVIDQYSIKDFSLIHQIIEKKVDSKAGKFRTQNLSFTGYDDKTCYYTPASFLNNHLKILFDYLKNSKSNAILKAIIFAYNIESIRPFVSANEKINFYWLKLILTNYEERFSFVPINAILYKNFEKYQKITKIALTCNDITSYILFMFDLINEAIKELLIECSDYSFYQTPQVEALMRVIQPYPLSLFDLMERLKLKSRDGFRKNYIIPALEAGLICMTEPDKPTSKRQKYFKL